MEVNIENVIVMSRGFVKNGHGIKIKKCCASCKQRKIDDELGRFCNLHKCTVASNDVCKRWELSKKLNNAGNGIGKVKCMSYMNFFRAKWVQQLDALEAGEINPRKMKCIGEIRREYEREFGEIYVNI